jgi:hypothetical protein
VPLAGLQRALEVSRGPTHPTHPTHQLTKTLAQLTTYDIGSSSRPPRVWHGLA